MVFISSTISHFRRSCMMVMTSLLTTEVVTDVSRATYELQRLNTHSYTDPWSRDCILGTLPLQLFATFYCNVTMFCDFFLLFFGIYSSFWQKLPIGKNSLLTSHFNDHHIKCHKIWSDHITAWLQWLATIIVESFIFIKFIHGLSYRKVTLGGLQY